MISLCGGPDAGQYCAVLDVSDPHDPTFKGIFPRRRALEVIQQELNSVERMSKSIPPLMSASYIAVELSVIAVGNWTRDDNAKI